MLLFEEWKMDTEKQATAGELIAVFMIQYAHIHILHIFVHIYYMYFDIYKQQQS